MFIRLLRPFAAVMSRLRYGQKFAFISFLMVIPIGMLLYVWMSEQQQELSFIENERAGASEINEIMPFMLLMQQHRGLANGFLSGNTESKAELVKKEQEINRFIAEMNKTLQYETFPESSGQWQAIAGEWSQLEGSFSQMKAKESFAAHSALIAKMKSLIVSFSDESGLSLDTAMDSFYLMTMLVQQLPILMENTAVIRGQGNGVLVSKSLTEDAHINILLEMAKMEAAFTDLNKAIGIVETWNKGFHTDLLKHGERSIEATDRFQSRVRSDILDAPQLKAKSDEFFAEGTATIAVLSELFASVNSDLNRVLQSRSEDLSHSRNLILIVTMLIILLVALFYVGFYRNVMATVNALKTRVEQMAKGDLSHKLQLDTRDELQHVALAFNEMLGALNVLMRRNQLVSDNAASSSTQLNVISLESTTAMKFIADAIQNVSNAAEMQSLSTSETASAMHEMAIGITRIAEASSDAAESAIHAAEHVKLGNQLLEETARQMSNIKSSQVESAQVVARLDGHSVQMEQIIGVIMTIARQTQLLALNANIEAARAGEHGRGFSVVASEVGKLAEQTALSVKSIEELLSAVRTQVDETVAAMNEMRLETDTGLQSIGNTQTTMSRILSDIRKMSEQVQEVSAASEQISAGMEEVTATIGEVAGVSRKTSSEAVTMAAAAEQQLASMEEIQTSSESLRKLSQQLQDDMSQFVLARE
ncbi:methyl-accepting chemotaxis protein [Paenibacillus sp. 2TAB23]|uniref:methyl-accepting chemotaxis protein n=1 Tax=Paenibacillus sp. 2TAB23 TaxID=3233004 RepID=UPI003F94A2B2